MPSKEILCAAYQANPHGCGFASVTKKYKGLSFATFMARLKNVPDSEPCIIHFRFATHGSIKPDNCHPFEQKGVFFAHNGILNLKPDDDMTDSETAFRKYIYPAIEHYGIDDEFTDAVIDSLIGWSKFAILCDGKIHTYGEFVTLGDGCSYSNTRFLSQLTAPLYANAGNF